jgi:hypothetical protein
MRNLDNPVFNILTFYSAPSAADCTLKIQEKKTKGSRYWFLPKETKDLFETVSL